MRNYRWLFILIWGVGVCAATGGTTASALTNEAAPDTTGGAATEKAVSASPNSPDDLAEIVVTAERRNESLERTPVSVTALTALVLQEKAVTTEGDLQAAVPGLSVQAGQNANQINYAIRGQSVDIYTNSSPAVLTYFNDVLNTPNSSTAFYDLDSIQVLKGPQGTLFGRNTTGGAILFTSVKPTDQLGGYFTSRVGNYFYHEFEGAINIPVVSDKLLVRLAGLYEDRDGFQTNIMDGQKLGSIDRRSARLSITFRPVESVRNYLTIEYAKSGGENVEPVAYSAYAPHATNNGTALSSYFSQLLSPAMGQLIGVPGAWNTYLTNNPGAYRGGLDPFVAQQRAWGPNTVDLNGLFFHRAQNLLTSNITEIDLFDTLMFKNIVGVDNSYTVDGDDYDGTPYRIEDSGIAGEPFAGQMSHYNTISEEPQIVGSSADKKLNYVVGAYFSQQKFDGYSHIYVEGFPPFIPVTAQDRTNAEKDTSYAVYSQGTYDISGLTGVHGLSVTAGVRYTVDHISQNVLPGDPSYDVPGLYNLLTEKFDKPSWQLGIQEQLTDAFFLYATTRHSFRAGGINQFSPARPGDAAVGGAFFAPETVQDVEIGAKFQGHIATMPTRINVALYNQWVNEVQRLTYADVPNYGIAALTVNIPRALIRGVELDADEEPSRWLELGETLDFTDATFTNNEVDIYGVATAYGPPAYTPRWSGDLFARIHTGLGGNVGNLSLRTDAYSQSNFYFSNTNNSVTPGTGISPYTLVNFRLALEGIEGSGWSIAAQLRNAFNRTYYVGGSPLGSVFSVNTAVPGVPRMFYLEANYKF